MLNPVRLEKRDTIGFIIVDNPPVNALSPGVPEGMADCVVEGSEDPKIECEK